MFVSTTCTEQDIALYLQSYISNLCSIDLQLTPQPAVALEITGHRIFALLKYTRFDHSNDTPHSKYRYQGGSAKLHFLSDGKICFIGNVWRLLSVIT
jgi:hypothetical protein